ncbi:MAG TPA: hypothetical protein DCM10_08705 [Xanthomarina gelatinilytica]|nr:hypothetical protein [Xanthomarina gelatinilytica]
MGIREVDKYCGKSQSDTGEYVMGKKIGIIGNGFVGNAIHEGLRPYHDIYVYDKLKEKCLHSLGDINKTKYVFICVPTPMGTSGEIDLTYLKDSIKKLKKNKILVIKSTVTPAAAEELIEIYPHHDFVFNPEFLTERTAVEDFKNPSRIVLGGDTRICNLVRNLYSPLFPQVKYIITDHKTACFTKYFCNCFFATKISIINEFRQIADSDNIDWNTALEGLLSSGWVNPMHTLVPGPDGHFGFGGKCFPKDINAFSDYASKLGIDTSMLRSAWRKNLSIREDKNWLTILGAIVKN